MTLNHAPDYREPFLRKLGKKVELTVVSQPCEDGGLLPPAKRENYRYIEIPSLDFLGLTWQRGIKRLISFNEFDVFCCSLNFRQPQWIIPFICHPERQKKWIWWGSIYGHHNNSFLKMMRKYLLTRAGGCLVYSELIEQQVRKECGIHAVSFNNTEILENEFRSGNFADHEGLHLLFVGRYHPRKNLQRLVELAERRDDIYVRLVGPGMDQLVVPDSLINNWKIERFGRTLGKDLDPHFDWADITVSPGDVGLFVMNAARYGKGIIIEKEGDHGPEYWLAKEAQQPFIDFENQEAVDKFFDKLLHQKHLLQEWGGKLQEIAMEKYTIEYMVEAHYKVFDSIYKANNQRNKV
ncbi:MAG: glycosyltransferase [Verrucomicrobiota bacterium]